MQPPETTDATAGQLERLKAVRSPISLLSDEEFAQLKGKLVALLLDGVDKGKVVATAPLDYDHPEIPRRSIMAQIAMSEYKHRRYQLRQILESPAD